MQRTITRKERPAILGKTRIGEHVAERFLGIVEQHIERLMSSRRGKEERIDTYLRRVNAHIEKLRSDGKLSYQEAAALRREIVLHANEQLEHSFEWMFRPERKRKVFEPAIVETIEAGKYKKTTVGEAEIITLPTQEETEEAVRKFIAAIGKQFHEKRKVEIAQIALKYATESAHTLNPKRQAEIRKRTLQRLTADEVEFIDRLVAKLKEIKRELYDAHTRHAHLIQERDELNNELREVDREKWLLYDKSLALEKRKGRMRITEYDAALQQINREAVTLESRKKELERKHNELESKISKLNKEIAEMEK